MCLVILSTAHPHYSLIVINNRDEYLHRPTAPASWWAAPNAHVLGGRDLQRDVQGTWLGITSDGRLAVLTNFHEDNHTFQGVISRGAIVNAFLTTSPDKAPATKDFARDLTADKDIQGVGGFSLVCGRIGEPLAIFSNRIPNVEDVAWIMSKPGETVALSNATFSDRSWPKVLEGEKLLNATITASVVRGDSEAQLIEELMKLLSTDTLPKRQEKEDWKSHARQLKNSIFIPVVIGESATRENSDIDSFGRDPIDINGPLSGEYGTQKQTVILVRHDSRVTFVERTLFDSGGISTQADANQDRAFEYRPHP